MPDAVASSAATSRTTAMTTCGAVRPLVSESARHMLQAPPSRKPPAISRTMPKSIRRLQGALGGRDAGHPRVRGDGGAQGAGERLELTLDDVVGVPAGVEHPHVQADPRVEGEGLQHVPGQ